MPIVVEGTPLGEIQEISRRRPGIGLALLGAALPAAPAIAAPNASPSSDHDRLDQSVREQAARHPSGTVHVLIQRKRAAGATSAVQSKGGKVRHELSTSNLVAADVPASKLAELANDPDVVRVASDPPMRSLVSVYDSPTDAKLLSAYPSAVAAPLAWQYRVRGTGIGVALLDSGVMPARPDFFGTTFRVGGGEMPGTGSRVVKNVAVAQSTKGPALDDNGHGTFVAGIIGGRGWGDLSQRAEFNQYVGIAPDVNLINVKVSDRDGLAHTPERRHLARLVDVRNPGGCRHRCARISGQFS